MSKLNEKIKIIADNLCAPKNEILENVTLNLVNEYLQDAALKGYELCQKEYEEKLRWIPIEEKLPEKIQKQPYITHVVQVKSTTFAEPLCAYYNHDHCVWLSYPFGNSAKLLTVTHWRYFL